MSIRNFKSSVLKLIIYASLAFIGIIVVFPFIWMFFTSFKSLEEATTPSLALLPQKWRWENWFIAFKYAPFGRYFLNSFIVATLVTVSVCITSLLAGYAFAKIRFPLKNTLFSMVMVTMMVPFESILIPNFILISKLGWYNSYMGLIVPWCASAFSILLIRESFLSVPEEYFDIAKVDGCSHIQFLIYLGIPLIKPMVITVALFTFLNSYNALLWPLIITADETRRVVQVGLTVFSGDAGVRVNLLMCASTLVALPTIVVYLFAQGYFSDEAIRSGLKG